MTFRLLCNFVCNFKGSQYDKHGNLRKWWSDRSWEAFNNRTKCVVNHYSNYTVGHVQVIVANQKQNISRIHVHKTQRGCDKIDQCSLRV